jgi:hypothetical protein
MWRKPVFLLHSKPWNNSKDTHWKLGKQERRCMKGVVRDFASSGKWFQSGSGIAKV